MILWASCFSFGFFAGFFDGAFEGTAGCFLGIGMSARKMSSSLLSLSLSNGSSSSSPCDEPNECLRGILAGRTDLPFPILPFPRPGALLDPAALPFPGPFLAAWRTSSRLPDLPDLPDVGR